MMVYLYIIDKGTNDSPIPVNFLGVFSIVYYVIYAAVFWIILLQNGNSFRIRSKNCNPVVILSAIVRRLLEKWLFFNDALKPVRSPFHYITCFQWNSLLSPLESSTLSFHESCPHVFRLKTVKFLQHKLTLSWYLHFRSFFSMWTAMLLKNWF